MSITLTYLLIFIALVIGGEVFLIPIIYLGMVGTLNLWHVVLVAIAATLVADSLWYVLGRAITEERLRRFPLVRRRVELLERMSGAFASKGAMAVLVLSKFVYGSRIIVQILCGIYRMRYWKYAAVNTVGILAWIGALMLIASVVDTGLAGIKETAYGLQIVFAVFAAAAIVAGILIRRFVTKRWFD